jgi:hypothetical protein
MPAYRCYYLSSQDRIVAVESFIAADDQAAMETAKGLFAARKDQAVLGYEVWEGSRLVGRGPK